MNRQTILLISDMRQVYLAEIMTKRGLNVRCLDIRNSGTVKEQIEKLKSFLAEADMLVNQYESGRSDKENHALYNRLYKTEAGKRIFRELYFESYEGIHA